MIEDTFQSKKIHIAYFWVFVIGFEKKILLVQNNTENYKEQNKITIDSKNNMPVIKLIEIKIIKKHVCLGEPNALRKTKFTK